jgi:predicted DCC family thiol-disulfide oxidoreductase YuxK
MAMPDTTVAAQTNPLPAGWVLYDGSCGFCARWVPFWGPSLRRRGYEIATLQTGWVRDRVPVDDAELMHDIRLLLADGSLVSGADVYRFFMRRIWWAWPLWLLASAPGLRVVFDQCYRRFADNRHRFSKACGLKHSHYK